MHHERKYQTSCADPGGMLVERRLLSRSVVPFELRLAGGKSVAVLPPCTGAVLSPRRGSSGAGACSGLQFAGGGLLEATVRFGQLQLRGRAMRLGRPESGICLAFSKVPHRPLPF
jgi:hypothetical protein